MAGQNGNGNGNGGLAAVPDISERGEVAFRGYGGRRPRVLAHGGSGHKHVTHDDYGYIYWTDGDDGTVTRLSKDGGVPLVLATEQRGANAITIAGGWLYWVNYRHEGRGAVLRMPAGGGEIELIEGGQELPCSIAVLEDTVVWTTFGDGLVTGTVMMKQVGGGPAVTLASKQKQPSSIALDAHQIYWTSFGNKRPSYFTDGSVARMPRDGERKRFLIGKNQSMPDSIVMDDEWVYWTTSKMIFEPYASGEKKTTRIVSWRQEQGILALDATHVYWLEAIRCPDFSVMTSWPNAVTFPTAMCALAQGNACVSAFTPGAPSCVGSAPAPPGPGSPVSNVDSNVGGVPL